MPSTIITAEDNLLALKKLSDNYIEIYSNIEKAIDNNFYTHDRNSYQFLSKFFFGAEKNTKTFLKILYKSIYQAEVVSADAAKISFLFSLNLIREVAKNFHLFTNHDSRKILAAYDKFYDEIKQASEESQKPATIENLYRAIDAVCKDNETISEVIKKALDLSGFEGKIFVNDGYQDFYRIEQVHGYSFPLEPFAMFFDGGIPEITNTNGWERDEVRVLIVDGTLEEVSQLDNVLSKANETKLPVVLIAHGFSEEVVSTCMQNMILGKLDVIPVRSKNDLSAINIMADISAVCNAQPITHLMGHTVSNVQWDDLAIVDKITVKKDGIIILNKNASVSVGQHVANLVAKRLSHDVKKYDEYEDLIDKRLRSLVSHSVIIHLPNISESVNLAERGLIDVSLRNVKTLLGYGSVDLNDVLHNFNEAVKTDCEYIRIFYNALKNTVGTIGFDPVVPTLSFIVSLYTAGKTSLDYLSSACTIVNY